jgi:hypothetical protein
MKHLKTTKKTTNKTQTTPVLSKHTFPVNTVEPVEKLPDSIRKLVGDSLSTEQEEQQHQLTADEQQRLKKEREEIEEVITLNMQQYRNALNETLNEVMNGKKSTNKPNKGA